MLIVELPTAVVWNCRCIVDEHEESLLFAFYVDMYVCLYVVAYLCCCCCCCYMLRRFIFHSKFRNLLFGSKIVTPFFGAATTVLSIQFTPLSRTFVLSSHKLFTMPLEFSFVNFFVLILFAICQRLSCDWNGAAILVLWTSLSCGMNEMTN